MRVVFHNLFQVLSPRSEPARNASKSHLSILFALVTNRTFYTTQPISKARVICTAGREGGHNPTQNGKKASLQKKEGGGGGEAQVYLPPEAGRNCCDARESSAAKGSFDSNPRVATMFNVALQHQS